MASKFQYKGKDRSAADVKKAAKRTSSLYDGYVTNDVTKLQLTEGEAQLRILPGTWTDDERWGNGWEIKIVAHFNIGPDRGSFLCLDKMFDKPCPICEARRDASDQDEQDALRPQERFLCWAINRADEKVGPQIWDMPAGVRQDINGRSVDKKSGAPILIDDPDEGYDVYIERVGTKIKTKWKGIDIARDPSPIADDVRDQDDWLDYIQDHPLPELLVEQDADYITKVLSGKVHKSEDDEGDSDRGRGRDTGRSRDRDEGREERRSSRSGEREEEDRRGGRDSDREERRGRDRDERDKDADPEDRRGRDDAREGRDRDERGDRDSDRDADRGRGRDRDEERGGRDRSGDRDEGRSRRGARDGESEEKEEDDTRSSSRRPTTSERERGKDREEPSEAKGARAALGKLKEGRSGRR